MLQEQKRIDASRICFFFGAGASIKFGIPSMKEMTSTFANELREKGEKEEVEAFGLIYKSLETVYGKDKVDIEAIMSVIHGLKEKGQVKDNIGDLGLFILERKGITDVLTGSELKIEVLNKLETKFKQYVRSRVILEPQKIDLLRDVYSDFFKQLCTVTNCSGGEESNPYKYTVGKWVFFTTNYDNAIEDFWVNRRKYHLLDLGFGVKNGKKVMDGEEFVYRNNVNSNTCMQLIKLHGSVNWIRNRDGDIEEVPYNQNYDEIKARTGSTDIIEDMMIYPLSQKQLYFSPYIQLFRILGAELSKRDFWVIIGYSFRDIIIRTMFEKAMSENPRRKILLLHPHGTEQVKPTFREEVRDQIICLQKYFAGDDYMSVNTEIKDLLLNFSIT
jgi:hypothetical protein